jgi:hypothetical protein
VLQSGGSIILMARATAAASEWSAVDKQERHSPPTSEALKKSSFVSEVVGQRGARRRPREV